MAYDAKTRPAPLDEAAWLAGVAPETRRDEAARLLTIFREVTGFAPQLWGSSLIGFGRYDYRYDSGHSGSSLATGFSPRKAELSIYILPGYADFGPILARLGPHRAGKSCLYLKSLSRVDETALRELIRAGLDDLSARWTVFPG
ncbi:MAG: DUF1801 domain-containing protein [Tabrizicola sp.]|nr:DUF1801 domain-containing protein [Tabrizicola sp.]